MNQELQLPEQFSELSRFAAWALPTSGQRMDKRLATGREEILQFYNAVLPRVEEMMELLNRYPLGEMPQDVKSLFDIALSFAQIAIYAEWFDGNTNPGFAFSPTSSIKMTVEPVP